jgi:hypothetical protein
MEALQRVKLAGFDMVIAELEAERDLLRRAARDLEEKSSGPPATLQNPFHFLPP